ncbi:putative invertase inhibitor [Morella rubra]|uniref:Putative invertase inhibitor n=1 Tax=Morella rubra TaxID=262757 RepID=A0A6A1WCI4_9ROSI|nr:putative invertase inhibitor [Morella rubra]
MRAIGSFFFLLSLSLSLLPSQTVAGTNSSNLIEHACEHSIHKDLCISSIGSDPSSKQADLRGLASIAVTLAYKNATNILDRLHGLVNNQTDLEPTVEQGLDDCADHYLDAAEQLENSLAALSAKAYPDVSTWVKVAVADADSCEAAFQGQKFEISHKSRVFRQLANNALAIVKVLTEN